MNIVKKLEGSTRTNNSLVCVGLDCDWNKLPESAKNQQFPQFAFNKAIIEATHDLVCAYKPNSAFYEARGADGIAELKMTCDYIRKQYPGTVIILDAKRADIGSTNEGYVAYAFDYLQVDAITLQPYLGKEAIKPFLDRKEKGCIILCRTSNLGAGEIQNLDVDGQPLYKVIARKIVEKWNENGNCLMVVGATYPEELVEVRKLASDMWFLIPGIGAQGGDIEKTVKAGQNSKGEGMIINSSRAIIFASKDADFAARARVETMKLRDQINQYR